MSSKKKKKLSLHGKNKLKIKKNSQASTSGMEKLRPIILLNMMIKITRKFITTPDLLYSI